MNLSAILAISFFPLALCVLCLALSHSLSVGRSMAGVLYGLAAVLAASIVQAALSPLSVSLFAVIPALSLALDAFFRIAFIEECAKFFAVALVLRTAFRGIAREERTALESALLVALSFAAFENVFYGIRVPASLTARSLFSLPVHASLTMIASLALSRGFRGGRYLLIASSLHAAFNLLMGAGYPLVFAGFLLVPVLALAALSLWLKSAHGDEPRGDSRFGGGHS